MSDLLPCPFCGGTTGRFATDAGSSSYVGKWGWWECDCGARAEDVRTGYDADGWQNFAIAAWNRRAPSAAFRAGAAEMRERAAELCDVPQWLKDVIPHVPATPAERAEYETRTNTARAIKAAIRALPLPAGGSGWRPIETAPRDGKSILCYAPGTPDRAAVRRTDYWWIEKCAFAHMRPSQPYAKWQPLPAAPEEEEG